MTCSPEMLRTSFSPNDMCCFRICCSWHSSFGMDSTRCCSSKSVNLATFDPALGHFLCICPELFLLLPPFPAQLGPNLVSPGSNRCNSFPTPNMSTNVPGVHCVSILYVNVFPPPSPPPPQRATPTSPFLGPQAFSAFAGHSCCMTNCWSANQVS